MNPTPRIPAHKILAASSLVYIAVLLVIHFYFLPQVRNLYLAFDGTPNFLISPELALIGLVIFYGGIATLSLFYQPFQQKVDAKLNNQWLAFAVAILMVGLMSALSVVNVYLPVYSLPQYL